MPSCRAIVQVETRILRSRCSMPFIGVRPQPPLLLCSRRPHRTIIPLSPSCRAIVQGDRTSRGALDALMAFNALFGVGPPPSLSSRRQHRTFISLSPSCRAIVQVETRSLCAHSTLMAHVSPTSHASRAIGIESREVVDIGDLLLHHSRKKCQTCRRLAESTVVVPCWQ